MEADERVLRLLAQHLSLASGDGALLLAGLTGDGSSSLAVELGLRPRTLLARLLLLREFVCEPCGLAPGWAPTGLWASAHVDCCLAQVATPPDGWARMEHALKGHHLVALSPVDRALLAARVVEIRPRELATRMFLHERTIRSRLDLGTYQTSGSCWMELNYNYIQRGAYQYVYLSSYYNLYRAHYDDGDTACGTGGSHVLGTDYGVTTCTIP